MTIIVTGGARFIRSNFVYYELGNIQDRMYVLTS